MPTFYGPPSDGTVIPADLEDAIAADLTDTSRPIGAALDSAGLGQSLRVVNHGTDGARARPDTTAPVLWVGTVAPANRVAGDLYYLVSPEPVGFDMLALEPTLWLDAQSLTVADGASVTTWADQSGNGYDAVLGTLGTGPVLTAASIGGKQAVYFNADAAQTYLQTPDFVGAPTGTPVTVLTVARNDYAGGLSKYMWDGGVGNPDTERAYFYRSGAGKWTLGRGGSVISPAGDADAVPHLFTASMAPAGSLSIDRTVAVSGTLGTSVDISRLRLGMRRDDAAMWHGPIGEVVVFHRELTSAELADAESYLMNKWGL